MIFTSMLWGDPHACWSSISQSTGHSPLRCCDLGKILNLVEFIGPIIRSALKLSCRIFWVLVVGAVRGCFPFLLITLPYLSLHVFFIQVFVCMNRNNVLTINVTLQLDMPTNITSGVCLLFFFLHLLEKLVRQVSNMIYQIDMDH